MEENSINNFLKALVKKQYSVYNVNGVILIFV